MLFNTYLQFAFVVPMTGQTPFSSCPSSSASATLGIGHWPSAMFVSSHYVLAFPAPEVCKLSESDTLDISAICSSQFKGELVAFVV